MIINAKWQQRIYKFWSKKTFLNYILLPLSFLYYLAHLINFHVFQRPKNVRPMVVCVGNAILGGAGKTPFAITLAKKIMAMELPVAFITRGYGSIASKKSVATFVNASIHSPSDVGDEALLLARTAPTYVASNRYVAAKAAEDDGAKVIIMDDGLQNNTLYKNYNFLILDENYGLGNGYPLPAGPLREYCKSVYSRADTAVLITQSSKTSSKLKHDIRAVIVAAGRVGDDKSYLAFCGIAHPAKFFKTLKIAGFNVSKTKIFDDHYAYSESDIQDLIKESESKGLRLITTEKDFVKIDPKYHNKVVILPIKLQFEIPEKLMHRLAKLI